MPADHSLWSWLGIRGLLDQLLSEPRPQEAETLRIAPSLNPSQYVAYTTDMERRRRGAKQPAISQISPEQRRDAPVRRKMSGPAMRTLLNIAQAWQLSNEEVRALLGWPPESTFYKYKGGQVGTLTYDMLMRISLVLGIYKDLRILYPERDLADRWVRLPNSNPLFGGKP